MDKQCEIGSKLVEMFRSAPTGTDIGLTIGFKTKEKKKEKREEKKKEQKKRKEVEVDRDCALSGVILPAREYATFDEMEDEARKIVKAAREKGISNEEEVAARETEGRRTPKKGQARVVMPMRTKDGRELYLVDVEEEPGKSKNSRISEMTSSSSADLKLCNSRGQPATSFDVSFDDSCSLLTDDIFQ